MGTGNYTVTVYKPALAGELRKFVRRFWPNNFGEGGTPLSSEQFREEPTNTHPTFLFLKDHEVIGHITAIPVQVACRSHYVPAYWVVGFMVLPEYRNGLIGPLLIKKENETLPFAMTLHVEENVLKIFKGLGWRHLGVLPQYVRVVNPYGLVNNLHIGRLDFLKRRTPRLAKFFQPIASSFVGRWIVSSGLGLVSSIWKIGGRIARGYQRQYAVLEEKEFHAGYDDLWKDVGEKFDAAVVRDRAYLTSRYGTFPHAYRVLACYSGQELVAYCILKVKMFADDHRMGNTRIGTIVDCLFDPEDARHLHALLLEAVCLFRKETVDAIVCTASLSVLRASLLRHGFFKIPGNLNFAFHISPSVTPITAPLDAWHLMRGDSDAAENF